jgi:hypothetical protein
MFALLAIVGIVLSVSAIPIITTLLFSKISQDDLESQRNLLAIEVEAERSRRRIIRRGAPESGGFDALP